MQPVKSNHGTHCTRSRPQDQDHSLRRRRRFDRRHHLASPRCCARQPFGRGSWQGNDRLRRELGHHDRGQGLQRPRRHGHFAGAHRRHEVRRHHQAHQRNRGHARPRPQARIRLPGLRLQDAGHPRNHAEGRRHARRDLLRGRRRHRPACHARSAASPLPWPMLASA